MAINPTSPLLQAILQAGSQPAGRIVRPTEAPAAPRPAAPLKQAQASAPARKTVAPVAVSRETMAPKTMARTPDGLDRIRPRGSIVNLLV